MRTASVSEQIRSRGRVQRKMRVESKKMATVAEREAVKTTKIIPKYVLKLSPNALLLLIKYQAVIIKLISSAQVITAGAVSGAIILGAARKML